MDIVHPGVGTWLRWVITYYIYLLYTYTYIYLLPITYSLMKYAKTPIQFAREFSRKSHTTIGVVNQKLQTFELTFNDSR